MDAKQPRKQLSISNLLRGLSNVGKDSSNLGSGFFQSKRGSTRGEREPWCSTRHDRCYLNLLKLTLCIIFLLWGAKAGGPQSSDADDGDREANFRQAFMMSELERVKESFTVAHDLKVVAVTWNLAGTTAPENFDISQLVNVEEDADIYVVGFQEIVPLTPGLSINSLIAGLLPNSK